MVYSKAYEAWKEIALIILNQAKYRLRIDFPIILECHFYVDNLRKRDLSAMYEGIQDCLVNAGVIADDNYTIVAGHDGSRIHYDKKNPRTEVFIRKIPIV